MKRITKVLSLVLSLILIFSCLGTAVFAKDEGEQVEHYETMLALGGSIARGCGLGDAYHAFDDPATYTGIPGAFTTLVADACAVANDIDHRCFCTFQGATLRSVLTLIGLDTAEGDEFLTGTQDKYWFNKAPYVAMKENFGEGGTYNIGGDAGKIATSDLIVLELGMGDVFYRPYEVSGIKDIVGSGAGTDALLSSVGTLLAEINASGLYVIGNYAKLLDYIKAKNPDAEVVIVGLFNILDGLCISDDFLLPVGDAGALVTATVNQHLKALASEYGYKFADITNVTTPASEQNMAATSEEFLADPNLNVHPSVENGLPYIARQIINVLPKKEPVEKKITDIVIDLGHVKDVDYVLVDNKNVSGFKLDGSVLTIPNNSKTALSVTVAAVGDDGKVTVQVYQLAFHNGYTAYRVYGNYDVLGSVKKVSATAKKLTTTIKNLFKK